jgi:hypothetical protein
VLVVLLILISYFNFIDHFLGICAPASCNETSLQILLLELLNSPKYNISTRLHLQGELATLRIHCVPRSLPPLTTGATITIVFIAVLVLLVAIGTYLEFEMEAQPTSQIVTIVADQKAGEEKEEINVPLVDRNPIFVKKRKQKGILGVLIGVVKCFGLRANTKFLVADNRSSDPKLACLNGLRVVMMGWVILGHTFTSIADPVGFDNLMTIRQLVNSVSFQVIPAAELAVGILNGYLMAEFI